MTNTVALIDGFNMYGALNAKVRGKLPFAKYKWINYWLLMEQFLSPSENLTGVHYFTTYPISGMYDWKSKRARHVLLADAQREAGVSVVKGRFAERKRRCLVPSSLGGCGMFFTRHEEKRTDVNIAVTLVSLAYQHAYDTAFLVTADADLIPAIKKAKEAHPTGRIINIPPIGRLRHAGSLKKPSNDQIAMKETHLASSLLPKTLVLGNGRVLMCPTEWNLP